MDSIYEFTEAVERRIPTFTRALDNYFDAHFEGIIEEWHLLTTNELSGLEKRLDLVTEEIDKLYNKKSVLEKRAQVVETEIAALEGGVE